jgi:16S rRNA processing protein RimM
MIRDSGIPNLSFMKDKDTGFIAVGRIVGVFGHRGWLKVITYANLGDRFEGVPVVYLERGNEYSGMVIIAHKMYKKNIMVKLKGIDNPEKGKEFIGKELFLPDNQKIELPADHYFLHDIIGLAVFDIRGQYLGKVTDVIPAGQNDVYVIQNQKKEIMIPAVAEFIKEINLKDGKMIIQLWEEI